MAARHLIDAHVLLTHNNHLLLSQRGGHDEFTTRWHLPSGKLDPAEPLTQAAAREAYEEVGLIINPSDLQAIHITHITGSGHEPRLGIFFHTTHWQGEPTNKEPDKCLALQWVSFEELHSMDIIEYSATGIQAFLSGATASYTEYGWPA